MKIEIDLHDILYDNEGEPAETLAQSIRRQVVQHIAEHAKKGVDQTIAAEVNRVLSESLAKAVEEQMPGIVATLMDQPYRPVDRWGDRSKETTFRSELLRKIQEEMTYTPSRNGFGNDRNAFTKAVDDTVGKHLDAFKASFQKTVDETFTRAALEHAAAAVKKRLGIS